VPRAHPGAEGQASSLAQSSAPGCGMRRIPEGSCRDTGWGPGSRHALFNLYEIFFYFKAFVHESTILSFPAITFIAYPGAILLRDSWTVYDTPC